MFVGTPAIEFFPYNLTSRSFNNTNDSNPALVSDICTDKTSKFEDLKIFIIFQRQSISISKQHFII